MNPVRHEEYDGEKRERELPTTRSDGCFVLGESFPTQRPPPKLPNMWAIIHEPCDENIIRAGSTSAPCAKAR
ncbi:MAG TPA: hypothetical protein VHQ64_03180, partial [Pyrinomonadaceae bacterium]|nr:hypothetical protein [Pyrinomonadaceae bacterium]